MAAITLERISELLDEKLKPIHGEMARINQEVTELKLQVITTHGDVRELTRHVARLDSNLTTANEKLDEHGEHLDAITAELHQVHKLASSTFDLLQVTREKFRPAIDEARARLGLPPIE